MPQVMLEMDFLVTANEASKIINVDKGTIRNYSRKGILPFVKLNYQRMYRRGDVVRLIKRRTTIGQ